MWVESIVCNISVVFSVVFFETQCLVQQLADTEVVDCSFSNAALKELLILLFVFVKVIVKNKSGVFFFSCPVSVVAVCLCTLLIRRQKAWV